jgi:transcriptional regulator with XRE-family HTH domain
MDLYDRITVLLKQKSTTKTKMCEDISISYNTFSTLQRKRSLDISGRMLKTIAGYLGVSMDFLITGNDVSPSVKTGVNNGIIGCNHSQNTITISNGEKHTRELSEMETELFRIFGTLDIKKKIELLTLASNLENKNKES